MKKKDYLHIFLLSMLVSLCLCFIRGYHFMVAAAIESFCFMGLTYLLLQKYDKECKHIIPITLWIILGRFILESPIRIFDFWDSMPSFGVTLCCFVGIVLGAVCYKEKRLAVVILSVAILVILSTVGESEWWDWCQRIKG